MNAAYLISIGDRPVAVVEDFHRVERILKSLLPKTTGLYSSDLDFAEYPWEATNGLQIFRKDLPTVRKGEDSVIYTVYVTLLPAYTRDSN